MGPSKQYQKPGKFDRNLVVIGAGSAGLVAAYIAATLRAKVTLIEKDKMGGDCLNTGCVPSKTLIRSAKILSYLRRAKEFGFKSASADFDFAGVMARVERAIQTVAPHDSVERYTRLGVECILGEARITSPYSVEVNGSRLSTRNIVVATGARSAVPPIEGLNETGYLTSETLWRLRELPRRLVVLGGGPIGCELAQAFARFGSNVAVVEASSRILEKEDVEFSEMVSERFRREGIDVRLGHKAKHCRMVDGQKVLVCEHGSRNVSFEFDESLIAVGRVPVIEGFGLEELGIAAGDAIEVNEYLQTLYPNIYVCGDAAGPYQFTHVAAHQAWYAAVNALLDGIWKFKVNYDVIPWATFTEPEVARVGLNEQQAREQGIPYEVTKYDVGDLDRAITEEEAYGLVKVLTVPGKDKILGVTIAAEHAADWIAEYVSAMRHGLGLNKILGTIHIYPTLAEANKYAAGEWRKAHAPESLLRMAARLNEWRRG
jgi:pyruvate/2-oxoglutarate dehydrogenase complex dihydrolipoamide dehydrogenase (E3) component